MPSGPTDRREAILRTVPEKTGKPAAYWIQVVRESGLPKHMQKIELLKSHGVGHSTASILVQLAEGDVFEDAPEDQVLAHQYAGDKTPLRAVYQALRAAATSLGEDVSVDPRRDYVAFSRRRQFAVVRPSTRTRVDLGLRLGNVNPAGRLLAARGLGSGLIDRKVELAAPSDVDSDVLGWLRAAYNAAG